MGRPKGGTAFGPGSQARTTFLKELAETGRFYDSCTVAGVGYHTMQKFRDPANEDWYELAFVAQVHEALEAYTDKLRQEVHRRGVQGWVERGVYDKDGNHLGDVHKFSDRLLELHVKRHDSGYREQVAVVADVNNITTARPSADLEALLRNPEIREHMRATIKAVRAAHTRQRKQDQDQAKQLH
jgi:hypothetical protein